MTQQKESDDRKLIFVIVPPAYGHINPVCGLVHELCKYPNVDVVFYSQEEFRGVIERTGAKFRAYIERTNFNPKTLKESTEPNGFSLVNTLIDSSYVILPQLIKVFYAYKPDLIIYDNISIQAK